MRLSSVESSCGNNSDKNVRKNIQKNNIHSNSQISQSNSIKKVEFTTNDYHPIVFAVNNNKGVVKQAWVLGGYKDNAWYKIDDFEIRGKLVKPEDFQVPNGMSNEEFQKILDKNYVDIKLVKGGEDYKFYTSNQCVSTVKASKPVLSINGYTNDKLLSINTNSFSTSDSYIIGINGSWNALPRKMTSIKNTSNYLVDIYGDKKEEILKIADVDKQTKNITLDIDNKTINIENVTVDGTYTSDFKVFAIDLNGDNQLEIVVLKDGHNLEVSAYHIRNYIAKKVLEFYQGD